MARTRKDREYADSLAAALKEAIAIKRGERKAVRVRRISAADVEVRPPPEYSAARIRHLREKLALSQAVFAEALNVSDATVKAWEQGLRKPAGAALRLLEVAEEQPALLASRLRVKGQDGAASESVK